MSAPHTFTHRAAVYPGGLAEAETAPARAPEAGANLFLRILRDVAALAVLVTCGWALIVGLAVMS